MRRSARSPEEAAYDDTTGSVVFSEVSIRYIRHFNARRIMSVKENTEFCGWPRG